MKFFKIIYIFIFFIFGNAIAQDTKNSSQSKNINFTSDSIEVDEKTKIITASGNVVITGENRKIRADKVKYDQNLDKAIAIGNVILTEKIREMDVIYETVDCNSNNEELNIDDINNMEVVYDILDETNSEILLTDEIMEMEVFYDVLDNKLNEKNSEEISNIKENIELDYFDLEVIDPEYIGSNFDSDEIKEIEDQNQIEFNFDLPVSDIDFEKKELLEVIDDEFENNTNEAKNIEHIDFDSNAENDFKFELKENSESEIENKFENEILKDEEEEENKEDNQSNLNPEISPFDQKINESLNSENEKRKEHLKKFNYSFANSRRIDELEKQPAYKRVGIDLEESLPNSDEQNSSRMSIDEDSNEEIQLRSNNSFLHDNVD